MNLSHDEKYMRPDSRSKESNSIPINDTDYACNGKQSHSTVSNAKMALDSNLSSDVDIYSSQTHQSVDICSAQSKWETIEIAIVENTGKRHSLFVWHLHHECAQLSRRRFVRHRRHCRHQTTQTCLSLLSSAKCYDICVKEKCELIFIHVDNYIWLTQKLLIAKHWTLTDTEYRVAKCATSMPWH